MNSSAYPGVVVLLKKSLVASTGVVQGDVKPDQVSKVDTRSMRGRRSSEGREINAANWSIKSRLSMAHTIVNVDVDDDDDDDDEDEGPFSRSS